MRLAIRLLGTPQIERDGAAMPAPRGRKTWAVLAYLLLCERPPPRSRVASLLFSEADDPLGALRWSLVELRRALGDPPAPVGVARQVRQHLGPAPARQSRLRRGLLVGEIGDRPQHLPGPLANRFDVGDGGVHAASGPRSGPEGETVRR